MAAPTSCISCVFGAATTSLYSFPYSIVGTVSVQIQPHLAVLNGSTQTVGFDTTTVSVGEVATTVPGPGGQSIVELTHASQLTWTTLGATLTYPTVYVGYLGFTGALATPSGCAESLSPTSIALPSDVDSASLIYPSGGNGLPAGLLGYLDSLPAVTSQLGGAVTACAAPGPAPASSATTSQAPSTTPSQTTTTIINTNSTVQSSAAESTSFLSTETSTITTSTTVVSTTSTTIPTTSTQSVPPPPTTIISPVSAQTTSIVEQTTQAVTYTPARIFSTVTLNPVVSESGSTSTLSSTLTSTAPTALAESVPGILNPTALSSVLGFLSSIRGETTSASAPYSAVNASITSAPYTVVNASSTTYALVNATSTTYTVPYTGAAQKGAQPAALGWLQGALALALPALL